MPQIKAPKIEPKYRKAVLTATWHATADPLFWCECPHCKNIIMMSSPTVIERLIKWAKKLKKYV